jgi:hypothetical protein
MALQLGLAGLQAATGITQANDQAGASEAASQQKGLQYVESYGLFATPNQSALAADAQAVFAPGVAAVADNSGSTAAVAQAVVTPALTGSSGTSDSIWTDLAVAVGAGIVLWFLTGSKS